MRMSMQNNEVKMLDIDYQPQKQELPMPLLQPPSSFQPLLPKTHITPPPGIFATSPRGESLSTTTPPRLPSSPLGFFQNDIGGVSLELETNYKSIEGGFIIIILVDP